MVKFHIIRPDLAFLENKVSYNGILNAVKRLQEAGGYLVFLQTKDHKDIKDLGIGAQILKSLGVEDFRLLSTSHMNEYANLSGFGLKILEQIKV